MALAYLVTEINHPLIAANNGGEIPSTFAFDTYFICNTVDDYPIVVSDEEFKRDWTISTKINESLGRYIVHAKE